MKTIAAPGVLAGLVGRLGALRPDMADSSASVLGRRRSAAHPAAPASRPLRKCLALYTALPWPKGLMTRPMVDPRADGTRPGEFEEDRRRVIAGLEDLTPAQVPALSPIHSHFGPMSRRDWHRWAYRHVDHHLRQFGLQ